MAVEQYEIQIFLLHYKTIKIVDITKRCFTNYVYVYTRADKYLRAPRTFIT